MTDVSPKKQRLRGPLAVLALIVLAVFAHFFWEPLYTRAKTWRAESFARESMRALEKNDPERALDRATAACRLAPVSPKALFAFANALAARNDPSAPAAWIALAEADPSAENLAQGCRAALDTRDFLRADRFLADLAATDAPPALVSELRAATALARGNSAEAAAVLLTLEKEGPLHPANALALSTILRSAPDTPPEQIRQDRDRLRAVAETTGREALTAIILLASDLPPGDPERDALAARLRSHPLAGAAHKLLADAIRLAGDPRGLLAAREEILAEAATWRPEETVAAAAWLIGHGLPDLAADLIPAETAATRRDFMFLRIRALEAACRFDLLDKELRRPSLPISEPERNLGLAVVAARDDRNSATEAFWARAITTAKNDPRILLDLAARAEALGWFDKAEALYEQLSDQPPATAAAFEGLVRIADHRGLAETLPVLERSLFAQPGSEPVLTSLLYAKLLLRKHSREDVEKAAALALKNRSMPACRAVLALAFLRENDPANALSALEDLGLDWSKEQPAKSAVFAAALAANGRPDEARSVVAAVGPANFRPEELALIREYLPPSGNP